MMGVIETSTIGHDANSGYDLRSGETLNFGKEFSQIELCARAKTSNSGVPATL